MLFRTLCQSQLGSGGSQTHFPNQEMLLETMLHATHFLLVRGMWMGTWYLFWLVNWVWFEIYLFIYSTYWICDVHTILCWDWSTVHPGVECPSYPSAYKHIWLKKIFILGPGMHIGTLTRCKSAHLTRCISTHQYIDCARDTHQQRVIGACTTRVGACATRSTMCNHVSACVVNMPIPIFLVSMCAPHEPRVGAYVRLPVYHAHATPGCTKEFAYILVFFRL